MILIQGYSCLIPGFSWVKGCQALSGCVLLVFKNLGSSTMNTRTVPTKITMGLLETSSNPNQMVRSAFKSAFLLRKF